MTLSDRATDQLGQREIEPDGAVLVVPVGYLAAAKLGEDTVVELNGAKYAFAAEETLPVARLGGAASEDLKGTKSVFCGHPNSTVARDMMTLSTLGLSSLLAKTTGEVRVCFLDEEGDDSAESAVLTGNKRMEDSVPQPVGPIAYTLVAAEPMGGESEISLFYRGKTGLFPGDSISFDLRVVEQGRVLAFDNVRTKVDVGELPKDVTIMGAKFTIIDYDSETGSIMVDIKESFPKAPYGVQTYYSSRRIPIYVPR